MSVLFGIIRKSDNSHVWDQVLLKYPETSFLGGGQEKTILGSPFLNLQRFRDFYRLWPAQNIPPRDEILLLAVVLGEGQGGLWAEAARLLVEAAENQDMLFLGPAHNILRARTKPLKVKPKDLRPLLGSKHKELRELGMSWMQLVKIESAGAEKEEKIKANPARHA